MYITRDSLHKMFKEYGLCVIQCHKPTKTSTASTTSGQPNSHSQPTNGLHPSLVNANSNLNSNLNSNVTQPRVTGSQDEPQLVSRVNINDGLYPFAGAVTRWQPNQPAIWKGLPRTTPETSVSATNFGFSHYPPEGRYVLNATPSNQAAAQLRSMNQFGVRSLEPERVVLNAHPNVSVMERKIATEAPIVVDPVVKSRAWGIYPTLSGY